jgi:hypothetical protein
LQGAVQESLFSCAFCAPEQKQTGPLRALFEKGKEKYEKKQSINRQYAILKFLRCFSDFLLMMLVYPGNVKKLCFLREIIVKKIKTKCE